MNLPNKLTFSRIFLSFICVALILQNTFASLTLALVVFILASFTDYLDGYIARKKNLVSDLGKLLDPIADKILIVGVFLAFLKLGVINTWMVVVIMLREFVITSLRLFVLSRGGEVLEAKRFGKHKAFSQLLGIHIIFAIKILYEKAPQSNLSEILYPLIINILMWYILIVTLFSGFYYLWANRKLIKTF
jgi:CDP-diacylglycerol--glycerol-3-phosphate 3-phosphatidyltransferase